MGSAMSDLQSRVPKIAVPTTELSFSPTISFSPTVVSFPYNLTIARLPKLYTFFVESNTLSGKIPELNQMTLKLFNVSDNNLGGVIPMTKPLSLFNASCFLNNPNLCGQQLLHPCNQLSISPTISPSVSPLSADIEVDSISSSRKKDKKRVAAIVGGSVGSFLFLSVCSSEDGFHESNHREFRRWVPCLSDLGLQFRR
ncbi:hypothetical protein ZOSMA_195G00300 [Zostera marina]|uniref:Uncharacterized protein n=1 Tax=Zostera marina TaxID=29655 RepID=A0A0K9PP58_ZOSMR|nr:hypothetical protein ZOSMA_195G00300 [Zostera marina]